MKEIKLEIENNIDGLKNIVSKSNSYADLCVCYKFPNNGKQYKYFKEAITNNNILINHWDRGKTRRKYLVIDKTCPVCKIIFKCNSGGKNSKTTCSCKCSNIYFSNKRNSEEISKKKSDGIKKYLLSLGKIPATKTIYINTVIKTIKIKKIIRVRKTIPLLKIKCLFCGEEKSTKKRTQRFCSNKCSRKYLSKDPNYIKKLSDAQKERVKLGLHDGWKPRSNPSYAELFFMKVLKNNNIEYKHDERVGKYYIDFAICDKKIALEIDGKQHKLPDRILSDIKKDGVLKENGWKIYRIEWNSINNDAGKDLMKEK